MVFNYMVKVGSRYYAPGEDVPIDVEESTLAENAKEKTCSDGGEVQQPKKRRRRKE